MDLRASSGVPPAWFLQCKLPESLVQALLRGEVISEPLAEHADADFELLARWERDFRLQGDKLRKAVLLELEARLIRLALSSTLSSQSQQRATGEVSLSKVEQMACFIAQHYTEPLTVETISTVVALHPNYAMSLFRKTFGTTLTRYVTQHRVQHAQRLLATTDTKIVDIAFASGFASASRFNAAFQAECGCSPREYRRQHAVFG